MDHNLLVSELQSLIVESKRRNPEVKDAGEAALDILKGGPQPRDVLADTLLAPVMLGCKTKNAKIVGISIAALQRLVALGGVPLASLPDVLTTLGQVAGNAVDIQLKILQTLLSILTYCKDMHGDTLGTALLLCFKLQDSRVSVVSSTAAATLRQAIMVVFDRVSLDADVDATVPLELATEPPSTIQVSPSAMDAYNILSDLCLLTLHTPAGSGLSLWTPAEKEKPRMLKLSSLQRTFGLELIESILSGYDAVVKKHQELLFLLRHNLHPLIYRIQSEKPIFPVALRICRLIYVLIRNYSAELPTEVESYLVWLIRVGVGEHDDQDKHDKKKKEAHKATVAPWLHVLALEILRGIAGDPALLRTIEVQYNTPEGPKLFRRLVSALGHFLNEKPQLLGVGSQMHGLGVPPTVIDQHASAGYLDMGIGMVASAASVGVSAVGAMVGSGHGGGLGAHSTMKQRLIEQHDKAEVPVVPETYAYLLAVQSLCAIAESIVVGANNPDHRDAARAMAETAWPALLASLSYLMATDLSDALFAEVLMALQDFTVACGTLDLATPRDAFLNTLARYAVPPPVVSAMQSYIDPNPKSTGVAENIASALGNAPTGPPSLSERNLACLRSLVSVAQALAGSLGPGWHDVLETLQNANYLLSMTRKPIKRNPPATSDTPPGGSSRSSVDFGGPKPDALKDLDAENIQSAVNTLFDRSADLNDSAFTVFITALCRLSAEMIGMPLESEKPEQLLSPMSPDSRRRTSGINITTSIKSGERSFGLSKLRSVAGLNLPRLIAQDPMAAWGAVTQHLLAVSRHVTAPSAIRLQASETLDEMLLASLRTTTEARVQHAVFDVLVKQVDTEPVSTTVVTDYDVRAAGYQTLNQILENSGHSLEVGWPTIFGMLNDVCKRPDPIPGRAPASIQSHRGDANLVRIAFPSLTLICTDFLSALDADAKRQCIACLGYFGRQRDDVNITLAAIGLLWTLSDAVQGTSKVLWLYLLTELLALARDSRLEVRSSAMQTLFRCVDLYGTSLSPELWEDVLWKVVFPLLKTMGGDESQVLALTSVGGIFSTFLPQISALPSSKKAYTTLLERLRKSFIEEPRPCSTAALRVLDRVLSVVQRNSPFLPPTWETFVEMGKALETGAPYTQENLVALTNVASRLHGLLDWTDEQLSSLSTILRAIVGYSRSPDYRPDVDVMSPLQEAVAKLVANSTHFPPSLVLSDLAEFASLAYVGDGAKVTYVALSKFAMPRLVDVFTPVAKNEAWYSDGTVENILGAYALPIKLKYDCPPANKFGSDPPLWRTAMSTFVRVLDLVMPTLETIKLDDERYTAIWAQVMDVYAGLLLAEQHGDAAANDEEFVLPILDRVRAAVTPRLGDKRVPDHILAAYAETLRKASVLYHYDVRSVGGTTAPVVAESYEATRYWAFDQLVASAARKDGGSEGQRRIAGLFTPSTLKRFESTLQHFLADAKLRGSMPFSRVREDELLYVLCHLVTMTLWEGSARSSVTASGAATPGGSPTPIALAAAASPRAHLFAYYPLLLDLAFLPSLPSMWITPAEHARVMGLAEDDDDEGRDSNELVEVSAKDLARRALELIGEELSLGGSGGKRV